MARFELLRQITRQKLLSMTIKSDLILCIFESPDGMTISALADLYPDISRRMLQRHLKDLVDRHEIVAVGNGRARRYYGPKVPGGDVTETGSAIPFSVDSREVLDYINLPLASRTPVGYQFEFLDEYQPNETHYLSASLRQQLFKMGSTTPHDAPAGTYSRAILNRLLIDLSWASSQLEGNTYTRLDTRELIEHGRAGKGKAAIETQMILNHKSAIEFLVENIDAVGFNRHTLVNLHSLLSENLLANPADEGRIRQQPVEIMSSAYRPVSTPQALESQLDIVLEKANAIDDPFEQSFFVMVHLPYLQPFIDINKRTSRLAANLPLFRANLCPLTFIGLPENCYSAALLGVYESTRVEALRDVYVWAYERSTQEYLAIKQNLETPDPLRLQWRQLIKQTLHDVLSQPDQDPLDVINSKVAGEVPQSEQKDVRDLIIEELKRVHIGVLARYGIRPSQFEHWVSVHRAFE